MLRWKKFGIFTEATYGSIIPPSDEEHSHSRSAITQRHSYELKVLNVWQIVRRVNYYLGGTIDSKS